MPKSNQTLFLYVNQLITFLKYLKVYNNLDILYNLLYICNTQIKNLKTKKNGNFKNNGNNSNKRSNWLIYLQCY